jgi:peptidoglycan/LPS O-acetylase OafA/YrhL
MMAGGIFSGAWILNEFYNWSRVLLAIMLSIMTYTLFRYIRSKLGGTTRIRWLDMADKFSYDIYICHMLFVKGMLSTIMLTSNLMVNLLITGILAIVNGIVLYYICRPKELLTLCKRYRRNDDSLRGRGFAKKK